MSLLDEACFGQIYAIDGWLSRRLELLDHDLNEDEP